MDKPAVILLLKKIMGESESSSSEGEGDYKYSSSISSEEGKRQAAKEILDAVRSSNIGSLVTALTNFMSLCNNDKMEMDD